MPNAPHRVPATDMIELPVEGRASHGAVEAADVEVEHKAIESNAEPEDAVEGRAIHDAVEAADVELEHKAIESNAEPEDAVKDEKTENKVESGSNWRTRFQNLIHQMDNLKFRLREVNDISSMRCLFSTRLRNYFNNTLILLHRGDPSCL